MEIRIKIDETGFIIPRFIPRDRTTLVAQRILVQRSQILPLLPEDHRDAAGRKLDLLQQVKEELELTIASADQDQVTIEPAPAVLTLVTREVATSLGKMNYAIDGCIGPLAEVIDGFARLSANKPRGQAGRLLQSIICKDGTAYLLLPSDEQWQETARRWRLLDAKAIEAAVLLGLADELEEVRILNHHFGRMQGLSEPADINTDLPLPQERINQHLRQIQRIFVQLLCLANSAWDDEDAEAAQKRTKLVGPYVDELLKISQSYSDRHGIKKETDAIPSEELTPPEEDSPLEELTPPEEEPTDPGTPTRDPHEGS